MNLVLLLSYVLCGTPCYFNNPPDGIRPVIDYVNYYKLVWEVSNNPCYKGTGASFWKSYSKKQIETALSNAQKISPPLTIRPDFQRLLRSLLT